jgi:hypothetical protein
MQRLKQVLVGTAITGVLLGGGTAVAMAQTESTDSTTPATTADAPATTSSDSGTTSSDAGTTTPSDAPMAPGGDTANCPGM